MIALETETLTFEGPMQEVRGALSARVHQGILQLVGERAQRLHFIDVETVDCIGANGNYVNIHVADECYIARNTLKRLESLLAPAGFVRIERSVLLNLRRVAFAERCSRGGFAFTLRTGRKVFSGRSYRRSILDAIRGGAIARMEQPRRE